jgi:tRNA pseudouridine38-40 synthase
MVKALCFIRLLVIENDSDTQRKMMSMAMLACRTASPPILIQKSFGMKTVSQLMVERNKIHIPKAPPLGLLLEAPQFKTYNDRLKQPGKGFSEERDPIDWSIYANEMKEFKFKWIYERLRQDELETHV